MGEDWMKLGRQPPHVNCSTERAQSPCSIATQSSWVIHTYTTHPAQGEDGSNHIVKHLNKSLARRPAPTWLSLSSSSHASSIDDCLVACMLTQ